MDVREKLVEIVKNALRAYGNDLEKVVEPYEFIADFLIHSGVTVQECGHWVSLTDCSNAGVYCSVCNKKVYMEDYAWCNRKNKLRSNYCPNCGVKMIPQKGKDEK